MSKTITDTRIAYGAQCTWWGRIDKVGKTPPRNGHSLPCCPECGGMLFEVPDGETWWKGVDKHEASGNPGYGDMIAWGRGRCFPGYAALVAAFEAAGRPTRSEDIGRRS